MIKNNIVVERISGNGNKLSEKFYCQNLKPMIRLPSILPTELMASFYSLLWSTCVLNQTKEHGSDLNICLVSQFPSCVTSTNKLLLLFKKTQNKVILLTVKQ